MNPTRTHLASLLFPLLLAACESAVDLPPDAEGAGGSGGASDEGGDGDGDAENEAGSGGSEAGSGGNADSGGNAGSGGASSTSVSTGGGPVRMPSGTQELSGVFIAGGETCPGTVLEPQVGTPLVFNGTTVGAADDYDTCGEADAAYDGAEVVYQFTLTADRSVTIALAGTNGFVGNLIVRSDCALALGETCVFLGATRRFATHLGAGTWSVMVDSLGAAGDYELSLLVEEPACGDGILNPTEACDPGPANLDDLCNDPGSIDECQVPPPAGNQETCPGEALAVPSGPSSILANQGYSTNGFADDHQSSCQLTSGGVERVFAIDPAVTGMLTVTIGTDGANLAAICSIDQSDPGCWDQMLHARTTCGAQGTEVACADDTYDVEEIVFPVTAGTPIFLFVDGYDAGAYSRGPFNLHFNLVQP